MRKNNFYEKLSYISFIIGVIIGVIIILWLLNLIKFEYQYTINILGAIVFGLGQIYHKFHKVPITEAITNYWKYKIRKEDKNKHNHSQDYASFKDEQNKKEKTFK